MIVLARMSGRFPSAPTRAFTTALRFGRLAGKYDAINIKLDKTGGLTEALAMLAEAQRQNFTIMIGCMVATSLAMAPAMLLAQTARFVDLDGPLLLSKDRPDGLRYVDSLVYPAVAFALGLTARRRNSQTRFHLRQLSTAQSARFRQLPDFVHEMCLVFSRARQF